ncbi:phosphopantetheine-binding protein [Rothia sp. P6271]|uniref:phosphopantetheine-binding protein n=1 Tax=unclassified Rothia (in: high G+C Gram-positive bacteria) TaxID=2689056 RepID=UPI003ABF1ACB
MTSENTLRSILQKYLHDADSLARAFDEPQTDLFTLGLDSMGAFALLDDLAQAGIHVEFTELVADPTTAFLSSR